MNIIYIRHSGSNLAYFDSIIRFLRLNKKITRKKCTLQQFIDDEVDITNSDIVLYQTWPDDRIFKNGNIRIPINNNRMYKKLNGKNHPNFPKDLIEKSDLKFLKLSNRKILIDLFDHGNLDCFSRFNDDYYPFNNKELSHLLKKIRKNNPKYFFNIERVKNVPTDEYLKKFNVIHHVSYWVYLKDRLIVFDHFLNRKIKFHYYNNYKNNELRPKIKKKLVEINNKKNVISFKKFKLYPDSLINVLVEISAPGWGNCCFRDLDALNYGALLFIHESLRDSFIIPYTKLIENEDYITYNLNNLEEKIDYILKNPNKINGIRLNGYKKFHENYNYIKNSIIFYKKLKIKKIIEL